MNKVMIVMAALMLLMGSAYAEEKAQTKCPVKGKSVDSSSKYVDVDGKRIYVCCNGCAKKVKKDAAKYIAKLKEEGVKPEKAPEKKEKAPKKKK